MNGLYRVKLIRTQREMVTVYDMIIVAVNKELAYSRALDFTKMCNQEHIDVAINVQFGYAMPGDECGLCISFSHEEYSR